MSVALDRLREGDINSLAAQAAVRQAKRVLAHRIATHSLATVMASPPTITPSVGFNSVALATSGSSITSARNIASIKLSSQASPNPVPNTDAFRFFGQPVSQRANSGASAATLDAHLAISGLSGCPYRVEFMTDAPTFEIVVLGVTSSYRLWVDGQRVTMRATPLTANDGKVYNLPVALGSGNHRITLDCPSGMGFMGVNVGPTYGVWASPFPIGPRLLVLGDSYPDGATGVGALDTWAFTLGDMIGYRDVCTSGIGGTGVMNVGGGAISGQVKINYAQRIAPDVIPRKPDMIIYQGSVNDGDTSAHSSGVAAQATADLRRIRAALPNAIIIVTGLMYPGGSLPGFYPAANVGMRIAAAQARADLFVDAYPDFGVNAANDFGRSRNWFWGNGNTTTPGTTTGNADVYKLSDVHPSQAGHDYIAMRIDTALTVSGLVS